MSKKSYVDDSYINYELLPLDKIFPYMKLVQLYRTIPPELYLDFQSFVLQLRHLSKQQDDQLSKSDNAFLLRLESEQLLRDFMINKLNHKPCQTEKLERYGEEFERDHAKLKSGKIYYYFDCAEKPNLSLDKAFRCEQASKTTDRCDGVSFTTQKSKKDAVKGHVPRYRSVRSSWFGTSDKRYSKLVRQSTYERSTSGGFQRRKTRRRKY